MNNTDPEWSPLSQVAIGGIKVTTASRAELAAAMIVDCSARRSSARAGPSRLIFDSNGHAISLAATDPLFRDAIASADVVHADGGFVVMASRLLANRPIVERSATTDLIHDFAREAESAGFSFYLLGGTEEVNSQCSTRLKELYPRLRIVGRHHGFFAPEDEARLVEDIARAAPDLLWIGLGKPTEQIFAVAHRNEFNAVWALTCGGCFNYIVGAYSRAPSWMQRANLEWLYRAFTDRRLFWRYATTSPRAIWQVLTCLDRIPNRAD